MHEFPLEGVVDGWQWSSLSLSSARWRRSAGWFPGSMCVPPPSKSHPALPLALPLPFRSLGVVIQISKSVCPLTPRISFPRLSILLRLSSSTSPAGSSSFHGNLEAGLCILYPVCDRSRLVMYAGPRMWISVSIYAYVCTRWGAFRRGRGNRVHVYVCVRVRWWLRRNRAEVWAEADEELSPQTGRVEGVGKGGGRGMPVLCTLQGCCNPPASGVNSPLSCVGGCHLPSLALPLSPWNFYESVLSLYIYIWRNGRADDALWFLPGLFFSGNRELPPPLPSRGWLWFFERNRERKRRELLGVALLLSFAIVRFSFFFFFVCN